MRESTKKEKNNKTWKGYQYKTPWQLETAGYFEKNSRFDAD